MTMSDYKTCPNCNEQVPALAVRCKFCGIKIEAPPPPVSDVDLDDKIDLELDDELSMVAPLPSISRLSAPPPPRMSTIPVAKTLSSSSPSFVTPPPPAVETAPPPPAVIAAPPPPAVIAAPPPPAVIAAPPPPAVVITEPPPPAVIAAPPPPAVIPPAVIAAPPPPAVTAPPPAVIAAPPHAAATNSMDASLASTILQHNALEPDSSHDRPISHSAPPPAAAKRTILGMAAPIIPNAEQLSHLPRPSRAPAPSSFNPFDKNIKDNESEFIPMPEIQEASVSALLSKDEFDSLDLDADVLDEDIDEIAKFTEQTAITDVSTLAKDMTGVSVFDDPDDDISPNLLDELMDPISGVKPLSPSSYSLPTSSANDPSSLPTAINIMPLGPLLEAETDHGLSSSMPPPRKGGKTLPIIVITSVLLGLAAGVYYLTKDDNQTENVLKSADASNVEVSTKDESLAAVGKQEKPQEEQKEEAQKEPTDTAPSLPVHKCKPLSDYPAFAWSDKINALAESLGKNSICGLFGATKENVVSSMMSTPNFGPTGYDLLPKSTVFEIFPEGKADRRAPSVEFIFVDDLLMEIHFKYGMVSSDVLNPDMFKPVLGVPKTMTGDPLDREIKIYTDEDIIVIWYKKTDAFQRVFNEVVFSSRIVRSGLEKELKKRSDAQVAFQQGMSFYNQKQENRAIDKFRRARQILPSMGAAYIFEGITLLQSEQFDKIEPVAAKAFENSTDDRARAGAKGLQAVVALYKGDKDTALAFFKNAAGLDPTDSEFATSVEELRTGNYDPARVAKTAARMDCRRNRSEWSVKGLLARGNFPDNTTFLNAKKRTRKNPDYKSSYDMWNAWECR